MDETQRSGGLAEALVDLSHHVLHLFADAGRTHRLSQQQVELICAVVVRKRIGMTDLGKVLHLEKSNLSNLVERLEQRDLVIRIRDPEDRRLTWVELTQEGTRVAMRTYADVAARIQALIGQLTIDDQAHLKAVVDRILPAKP